MKKVLLGTSAIALAGAFATTANAVEWDVRVGGYMEQYVAYSSSSVDNMVGEKYNGVDSKQDAEIHFMPSITLDNGIKIGAHVELEGNTSGDQIDESYMFVEGSFGRVLLGSENSVGYLMSYGAPDVTFINVNSGSLTAFMPITGGAYGDLGGGTVGTLGTGDDFFRGTLGSTFLENARNNDAHRFSYITPRFAGFQLGLSYARDDQDDSNEQLNLDVYEGTRNIFDVAANYVATFGDFDIAASGRYGMAKTRISGTNLLNGSTGTFTGNSKVWGAGLNLGYAGFTVGGSFAEQNEAAYMDGQAWDAGVSYETGPWGFSFTYMRGKNVDNESYDWATDSGSNEKLEQYLAGVSYTLAKGVALNAFGAYVDFKEDAGDAAIVAGTTGGGDNVDGWVVGTGIKIAF